METQTTSFDRVIGLDCHPDTFTAAIIRGQTPAQALVQKTFIKVPLSQLKKWAGKNTTPGDVLVLEASGNSFKIVRWLEETGRTALVLESCQMGKLKEAHANNDRISAIRIGKAFLAGTAKKVWVPDAVTQERRDWLHAHRKAVNRSTQLRNRLQSYLSDNGVRINKKLAYGNLQKLKEKVTGSATWSPRQLQVIEGIILEISHAQSQRQHWRSLIAQEVASDAQLLALIRLCGVRDTIAFALGALIGDIKRFASPRQLVKYTGLDPAFDQSGEGEWTGGISGHGRKDLRALLVQGAQAILRSTHPLGAWGKKLLARKGSRNLAVAAVARKLVVSVWYLMMGRWTPLEELDQKLRAKVGVMVQKVGPSALQKMKKTTDELKAEMQKSLLQGKIYVLDPDKKMPVQT